MYSVVSLVKQTAVTITGQTGLTSAGGLVSGPVLRHAARQALTSSRHLDTSIPVGGRHTRLGSILSYFGLQGVLGKRVGFVPADQHTDLQSLLRSRRRASEGGNPGHRKEATRDKLGAASWGPVWPRGKALGWYAEGLRFESASALLSLQKL